MTIREHFDLYMEVEVTEEVRNCLKETRSEHVRCKNRDYQYGVLTYPFGTERPPDGSGSEDAGSPLCCHVEMRGESAEREFFRLEAERAFQKAMSELGGVQRRRLELHFLEGLSFTEIARREGVSEGAVRHQIKRSLTYLRRRLTEDGYTLSDFLRPSSLPAVPYKTRNSYKTVQK